jgi:outer membrane protein OmpA-like peptidoglycan-associated protein
MRKTITLFAVAVLAISSLSAQGYARWSLALKGGINYYRVEQFGSGTTNYLENASWSLPILQLEYTANPYYGIGLEAGMYKYDSGKIEGSTFDAVLNSSLNLSNLLAPTRKGFWKTATFFGNFGLGAARYHAQARDGSGEVYGVSPVLAAGVNVDLNISKVFAVILEGQYRTYTRNNMGGRASVEIMNNDAVLANIGLRWKIGATKKNHVRNEAVKDYYSDLYNSEKFDNTQNEDRLKNLENQIEELKENGAFDNAPNERRLKNIEDDMKALNSKINKFKPENAGNANSSIDGLEKCIANLIASASGTTNICTFNGIYFGFDSADLTEDSKSLLDKAAVVLNAPANKGIKVKIIGHTDNFGSDAYNAGLSKKRAEAVRRYLVGKGVKIITATEGKGAKQPVDTNDTEAGRINNRRVDFEISK